MKDMIFLHETKNIYVGPKEEYVNKLANMLPVLDDLLMRIK